MLRGQISTPPPKFDNDTSYTQAMIKPIKELRTGAVVFYKEGEYTWLYKGVECKNFAEVWRVYLNRVRDRSQNDKSFYINAIKKRKERKII